MENTPFLVDLHPLVNAEGQVKTHRPGLHIGPDALLHKSQQLFLDLLVHSVGPGRPVDHGNFQHPAEKIDRPYF